MCFNTAPLAEELQCSHRDYRNKELSDKRKKKDRKNKVWYNLLHFKMVRLKDIFGHIQKWI